MAKYTIQHTCGHGRIVNLLGKNIERERKIEWMESQECPQCWGLRKRAEEAKMPITATISTNGMDTDKNGNILAEIVLTGGTIARKDEIKEMGYSWGEVRGGIMNMLSTRKPVQGWIKRIPLLHLEASHQIGKKIKSEMETLGAEIKNALNPLDLQMASDNIVKKNLEDIAIAKLEKPKRPECLPSKRGRWNGKIYGNEGTGYRVYIDGSEEKIIKEEAEEIKKYTVEREKYNMAVEKIKRGESNA